MNALSLYQLNGNRAFMGTGHLAPVNAELRKLKLENEILKKQRHGMQNLEGVKECILPQV